MVILKRISKSFALTGRILYDHIHPGCRRRYAPPLPWALFFWAFSPFIAAHHVLHHKPHNSSAHCGNKYTQLSAPTNKTIRHIRHFNLHTKPCNSTSFGNKLLDDNGLAMYGRPDELYTSTHNPAQTHHNICAHITSIPKLLPFSQSHNHGPATR